MMLLKYCTLIIWINQIVAQIDLKRLKKCDSGSPLKDGNGNEIFCGRGPTRQECPLDYFCNIHPTDRFAVCCEKPLCKYGNPLNGVFCGRGPNRQDCPKGYTCNIHPLDKYAVCCADQPSCPKGQVFDECYTACPPTCEDFIDPQPKICTQQCVIGCRCADKNPIPVMKDGKIVKCRKVDSCCPSNQVWRQCISSSCTPTCENPNPICTRDCVDRCACPVNKPFWHKGKCVNKKKCPLRCYPKESPKENCFCTKCKKCKGQNLMKCLGGNDMCMKTKGKKWCCCCERQNWVQECNAKY